MRGIRVTSMTDEEKKKIASIIAADARDHIDELMGELTKRIYEAVTIIMSDTIHEGCTYEITVPVTLRVRGEKLVDMIKRVKGVYVDFD
jgi:CheY-specific phosphatase CheX